MKAAAKGDVSKLKALLAAGHKVDERDANGWTALMRAAGCGRIAAARFLLTAGADAGVVVLDRDSIWFGCNALMFAAQSGNAELVEVLLKAGCVPGCKAADGTTPLSLAAGHGSSRMVTALLKAGAVPPTDILLSSVWDQSTDVSLLLIAAGANTNACNDLGQSVLHRTAETGQLEVLQALIRSKAKLDHKANGRTPLLIAIHNGHTQCAVELVQSGADFRIASLLRRDALMNAAFLGQTDVVRALVKAGADVNSKDKQGKTALMLANERKNTEVVELLRGSGSDESGYNEQEYLRAATEGDVERVRKFLGGGVNVDATYPNSAKALISAVAHGHKEVVRLLIDSGVDISAEATVKLDTLTFHADATALAAKKGHLEILRMLIKAGADVNQSRLFGTNVLAVAAREGDVEIVRELLQAGFSLKGGRGLEALDAALFKKREKVALALIEAGVKVRGKNVGNLVVGAVEQGMARVVKALLNAGVDPKQRNEFDEAPLQVAERLGRKGIAAMLRAGKSPQASPGLELIEAAERGDLKVVHRLILEGVELEVRDARGATALIRASANGHLSVMKALLAAGADPNAATPFVKRNEKEMFHHMDLTSETPLSCAAAANCLPAVELLLAAGADVNKTECGHVVCMILQDHDANVALVERLLDAGMNLQDARWPIINVSALETAAQHGFTSLVQRLIHLGARLKTPSERDRVIVDTINNKHAEAAQLLIERGIAPNVKGTITAKALIGAAQEGFDDVIRSLLNAGAKINRRGDACFDDDGSVEGVTALIAAARHGHLSTIQTLLAAGADPNGEDCIGRTALDWADMNKSERVARQVRRILEEAGAKES